MTTEINKAARNPDYHAAVAAEALALRCLSHYRSARNSVENYGGDLSHLVEPPAFDEIDARYAERVHIVINEPPDTTSSEVAYLELAELIISDEISGHEGRVMSHEEDLCCVQQILHWIIRKANNRGISEAIDRERKTPLPADSHGSYILDQMRAALDRIQAGKGGAA